MADVSIIIPVYNVEKYLDRCIESVVNQSYSNIEIIIVNDGSTDKSGEKCLKWAKSDDRIVYISKENEGAGPARNLAIRLASTEFLMFCDPDDWYDNRYVEVMLNKQLETDADAVICRNCYRHVGDKISIYSSFINELTKREVSDWTWTLRAGLHVKLLRKSLFVDNNIVMPVGLGQDSAIHYYLMSKLNKIEIVDNVLYHWFSRPESALNSYFKHTADTISFLKYGWDLFIEDGTFDENKNDLLSVAISIINVWYYRIAHDVIYMKSWLSSCIDSINEYFNELLNTRIHKICVIGSYSLFSSIPGSIPKFPIDDKKTIDEYCYTGLISYMSSINTTSPVVSNYFKQSAIDKDFSKTLVKDLYVGEYKYMIIDFLDERFDIAEMDGGYFTLSEILKEANIKTSYKKLKRTNEQMIDFWKEKCLEFIEIIKRKFFTENIILVKNYLSEVYFDEEKEKEFNNITQIKQLNLVIDECYKFFEKNCSGIKVIELRDSKEFYSDKNFRHGCVPWHYNQEYYSVVKDRILDYIIKKGL